MQYGFIPGLGYLHIQAAKGKELPDREWFFRFLDLKKTFERVPRNVWCVFGKLGVGEWLLRFLQSMFTNVQSRVMVNSSFVDDFLVL